MLPPFELEEYLEEREFTADIMFCSSDLETLTVDELLDMEGSGSVLGDLRLGYTNPRGDPVLRAEIVRIYTAIEVDDILVCSGAEEALYCFFHSLLNAGDHVLVTTPCYQSLESLPRSLADVASVQLRDRNGAWRLDLDLLEQAILPNTKVIVLNSPHNPTGMVLSADEQAAVVEISRGRGIWILSDEVYRFLEPAALRLPPIADLYERGVSLGVMSKAYGLAGLRIGWVAARDGALLRRMLSLKHYLTICNSGPSELLAAVALRASDRLLERNWGIVQANLPLLTAFFERWSDLFEWIPPQGGCVGFPRLLSRRTAAEFASRLEAEEGVLILPGNVFNAGERYFRVGCGRKNMPEALRRTERFLERNRDWMGG